MSVVLVSIYEEGGPTPETLALLYTILLERRPDESISHKQMPTWEQHCRFVAMDPYLDWALILADEEPVGTIYVTENKEIGIGILSEFRRHGYAKDAIELVKEAFKGEKLYANINPKNQKSIDMFEGLGFTHCQNTYVFE